MRAYILYGAVRCGRGPKYRSLRCGAGPRIGWWFGAVRVRASSLRGGAVAGQTLRPAHGSITALTGIRSQFLRTQWRTIISEWTRLRLRQLCHRGWRGQWGEINDETSKQQPRSPTRNPWTTAPAPIAYSKPSYYFAFVRYYFDFTRYYFTFMRYYFAFARYYFAFARHYFAFVRY